MHELSLAHQIVESAEAATRNAGALRVERVRLRIGALAGVDLDALRFAYEIAAADTLLAAAHLEIDELPVLLFCAACGQTTTPADPYRFRCAACGAPTNAIRQGRELELATLEVADDVPRG